MKQILIFMTTIMLLVGCGGGSSSNSGGSVPPVDTNTTPDTPDIPDTNISMTISQPYTVYPGDQVVKTVPEALVQIMHTDEHNESTIVLLEGNATIIRQ